MTEVEFFLSGPSAVDERLTFGVRSAEGLMSVAVHAVDILLCYCINGARPSAPAAHAVLDALEVYAEALPQSGPFHKALVNLLHQTLGVTMQSTSKATQEELGLANYSHLLRALASGETTVNNILSHVQLLRDLCVQLHLCNYLQSVRLFSLLEYVASCHPDQTISAASQVFTKQVSKHLRNVLQSTESPAVLWEYRIHRFLTKQLAHV